MDPTQEFYSSLQTAFLFFNERLFEGELPHVIFTVQRKKGVMGYFAPERWGNVSGNKCHEIAINPSYIANSRLIEVMQTLVHEMVHCWQHCFGNPGRDYYHNKEWALKMIKVGLMPSSTGEPGGAIVGQHMGDYIIESGEFLKAFNELLELRQFQLSWFDRKSLPRLFDPIISTPGTVNNVDPLPQEVSNLVAGDPELSSLNSDLSAHYLEAGDQPFSAFVPEGLVLEDRPQRKTRYRYMCYGCYAKVYGKPRLKIRCVDCELDFECEEI